MPDVISRIAGPVAVASGTSTLFLGTALHRYAIRTITLLNAGGGNTITVKVGIGGVLNANLVFWGSLVKNGGQAVVTILIPLNGAETIQVNASGAGVTAMIAALDSS